MSKTTAGDHQSAIPAIEDVLHDVFEVLAERGQRGLETGFFEVDDITNGLQDGELIIVAGRPSIGKTSFVLNLIEHVTVDGGLPSAIFTMEMTKEQLAQRLLCSRANLDAQRMRKGFLSSEEFHHLASVVAELAKAPLYVSSLAEASLDDLSEQIRTTVAARGIRLVAIDYVQLIEARGENRTEQLTRISRRLKSLAMDLRIPIVCVSQLNRGMFQPSQPRPRFEDLRGSGTLEDEADVIVLLHREDYYRRTEPDFVPDNIAEVIIAKQRNGPTGTVKLTFADRSTRFENLSTHADPF